MLSARSVAEFCRKEAALFAAMSRLLASCRCLSGRSRDFSLVMGNFPFGGFFGTGGGTFLSSCNRRWMSSRWMACGSYHQQNMQIEDIQSKILITYIKHAHFALLDQLINRLSEGLPILETLTENHYFSTNSVILCLQIAMLPFTVLTGVLHMQSTYLTFTWICLVSADTLLHSL